MPVAPSSTSPSPTAAWLLVTFNAGRRHTDTIHGVSSDFLRDLKDYGLQPKASDMVQLKIHEMAEDERPREKLAAHGAHALSDAELIAILLRTGVSGANAIEVARQLLEKYGSLTGLSRCSVDELSKIKGVKFTKAVQLVAAFGLGDRLARERWVKQKIDSPELANELALITGAVFPDELRDQIRRLPLS